MKAALVASQEALWAQLCFDSRRSNTPITFQKKEMLFQILLILLGFLLGRKWLRDLKFRDFPGPSPFLSLPVIGHGYLLGKEPPVKLMEMQKKYGDVFRLDIGAAPTIILCKYDAIKASFSKESFSGRYWTEIPTFKAVTPEDDQGNKINGVVNSEGELWYDQRKFMLKSLSDLGMGKRDTMEDVIEQEAEQLAAMFKKNKGRAMSSRGMFLTASNNVVWRISTGKRTKQDDPELIDLTGRIVSNFKTMDPSNPMALLQMNSVSVTRLYQWLGLPNFLDSAQKIKSMVEKTVKSCSANESGNYIERGLNEIDSDVAAGKNTFWSRRFGLQYLIGQLMDLFIAGTDTTATTIEWVVLYLAKHPELQEKMYQEINSITGDNARNIGLGDRKDAHFANAFIDEVTRHCQMATFPPPHKMLKDDVVQGKMIPKETQVLYFNYGINHDPDYFPEPDVFKPERFLDKDGIYCKDEHLVFFGVGKRRCPGELLARAEVFLFVTRVIQQFKLTPVDEKAISFTALPGLVFYPKPYELIAEERT